MARGDCIRCVVGDAQPLPESLKIRGAREAWYCRLAVDAPDAHEELASTYVVLVNRCGIASVTDIADVQQRALRSAEWRVASAAERGPGVQGRVLRAIALAYPQTVEALRREFARTRAKA
jgi:hypothetical protein